MGDVESPVPGDGSPRLAAACQCRTRRQTGRPGSRLALANPRRRPGWPPWSETPGSTAAGGGTFRPSGAEDGQDNAGSQPRVRRREMARTSIAAKIAAAKRPVSIYVEGHSRTI
jgi:hypothetical protein